MHALAPILALVLAWVGVPAEMPLANAELLTAALVTVGSCAVTTALSFVVVLAAFDLVYADLSREFVERRLTPVRPKASLTTGIMVGLEPR